MNSPACAPRRLTARQRRLLVFLIAYYDAHHVPPTTKEVCAEMGWGSTNSVADACAALDRKGWIQRGPKGSPRHRVPLYHPDGRPWRGRAELEGLYLQLQEEAQLLQLRYETLLEAVREVHPQLVGGVLLPEHPDRAPDALRAAVRRAVEGRIQAEGLAADRLRELAWLDPEGYGDPEAPDDVADAPADASILPMLQISAHLLQGAKEVKP